MKAPLTTKTGVQMGIMYINNPRPMQINDPDMTLLQSALILKDGEINKRKNERRFNVAYIALTFACIFYIVMRLK